MHLLFLFSGAEYMISIMISSIIVRWPGWIERMDNANLIRSMSKKGCSPDNSACEGVFGRLKIEMFYGVDLSNVTINEFISISHF